MDLSPPHFSPQVAANLASSVFFFPTDFISREMYLHEVIVFPTYTLILVIRDQEFGHHPFLWPYSPIIACVARSGSPFTSHFP